MKNRIFTIGILLSAAITVTSCRNDFDFDGHYMEKLEYAYAKSFQKIYGEIDPDQSWDFSTFGTKGTRAEGDIEPVVDSEWYYVENVTLEYMLNELKEGDNNRAKGNPFVMSAPNNGFAIYPIYQGGAAFKWDLHMVVEQNGEEIADINVWQKHRDIESQLSEEQIEQDLHPVNRDGNPCTPFLEKYGYSRNTTDWYDTHHSFSLEPGGWWQNYEFGWNTMAAAAIRTKGIHFPTLPIGANIYFYLDVKQEVDGNWVDGKKESSLAHMMVALNCETPTNLPNHEIVIIGCEDNSGIDSDWDMNDLVFMVVGDPIVPKPIVIRDDQYDELIVSKRYMVEDLGSTDDIDFNDVVIDLEYYKVHKIELVNGVKVSDEIIAEKQNAKVRAMGGTLDFDVFIGSTRVFTKSEMSYNGTPIVVKTMYNTLPGPGNIDYTNTVYAEQTNTGKGWLWIPEENNISFRVYHGDRSVDVSNTHTDNVYNGYQEITFPENGQIPYIIAFDTDKDWRDERHEICRHWVNDAVKGSDKCSECE